MDNETRYTVIGAGHGGKAMAAHLALMGFAVTLYNRTPDNIAADQASEGDRSGELRRRAARLWPAGPGHLGHGRGAGPGRRRHGGGAFLGARRHRPRRRAAPARWADRRAAPGPHLRRDRVREGAARQRLPGRRHRGRSRDVHLRQPLRRPGPGAHLSHQGSRAAGGAAGHAHAAGAGCHLRRPIPSSSTASTCCRPA